MLASDPITPIQVSKWVKISFLIDITEMENLITEIPIFKVYDVQRVTSIEEGIYPSGFFIEKYRTYISHLKNGEIPPAGAFRSIFSTVWSVTDAALFAIPAQEGRRLLKAAQPVIQIQMNQIRWAAEEKIFRNQVFSNDSISWGIQIGFPHVYLDPQTYETGKTRHFPNMALFLAIQRWIRKATVPTPFLVNGERINSFIRLGKECFSWIIHHPQLKASGIEIVKPVAGSNL